MFKTLLAPLRGLVRLVLALVILFEEWGWEPLQRAMAAIGRLPVLRQLEAVVRRLPPYLALVVFFLPGLMLLPIAYATFVLMMNRRSLLGDDMPIGWRRAAWNGLMLSSLAVVVATSLYMIRKQTGAIGFVVLVLFLAAVLGAEVYRWFRPTARAAAGNVF